MTQHNNRKLSNTKDEAQQRQGAAQNRQQHQAARKMQTVKVVSDGISTKAVNSATRNATVAKANKKSAENKKNTKVPTKAA